MRVTKASLSSKEGKVSLSCNNGIIITGLIIQLNLGTCKTKFK